MLGVFMAVTNLTLRFKTQGGTAAESLSLQNIQSRLR
jgi:NAD+ synthase (glutamine-hydrolysing)